MTAETGKRKDKPYMIYEGDRRDEDNLQCVWYIGNEEVFRHPYKHIFIYASMLNCNFKVRLAILNWAEMIARPD
jgi:uncharacterized protein involved in tellurium resistance